jgi:membrane-bound lytic murein transglycosylase MltF
MKTLISAFLFLMCACKPVTSEPEQKVIQISLSEYTLKMMDKCGIVKTSPLKKELLVKQIVRVAEERLSDRVAQEAFVTLICIESKFNQSAKSPVGATGLTQVMPKYIKDFAKACTIEVHPEDASDPEINLILGACYFNSLLTDPDINNNVGLALGAYNAGKYGDTFKKLTKMQAINTETANYISKYLVLRESMDIDLNVVNR